MRDAGFDCPDTISADGKLHRFAPNRKRDKDGWYVLFESGGAYGDWSLGIHASWSLPTKHLSEAQRFSMHKQIEASKRQHEEESRYIQEKTALQIKVWWDQLKTEGESLYLAKKKVKAFGIRFGKESVVIPMYDTNGKLWNLQKITHTGDKRFQSGAKKKGCFFTIGTLEDASVVYVCEGYATGASIHEAVNQPTVVAFDAGNLMPVLEALRKIWPSKHIAICADNDKWKETNVGMLKAQEAANACRCQLIVPQFKDTTGYPTDFNDLHVREGLEVVQQQIESATDLFESEDIKSKLWAKPDMHIAGQLEPPPCFPIDILPAAWQDWIVHMADCKGCKEDFIFGSLMVSTAGLIGNARRGSPWAGWDEPTIIWCALVGLPSSGKSPAMDAVLYCVREMENEMAKTYKDELLMYEAQAIKARQERKKWEERIENSTGQYMPSIPLEAQEPIKPTRPRLMLMDTSIEEAAQVLHRNPRGILMVQDELSRLIENFSRHGGSDRSFYLEGFGGRPFTVDRVKQVDPIIISSLAISLLGGIQPDRLCSLVFQGDDDGFAARLLYIWPVKAMPRQPKSKPDNAFLRSFFEKLRSIKMPLNKDQEPTPLILPFSKEAINVFCQWRKESALQEEHMQGILLSHLGKFPGIVIRISVVLAYLEWGISTNIEEPKEIEARHISCAIALIEAYFLPMAKRCFLDANLPESLRDAKTLANWIQHTKPTTFNASEVSRMRGSPLRHTKRLDEALAVLIDACWVRAVGTREGRNAGRRTKDFEVNPGVFL